MTSGWQKYPSKSSSITGTAQWQRTRRQILVRDNHECQIRGPRCTGTATTVDKIIPAARGGEPFDPENLRSVCKPCHDSKTAAGKAARGKRRPPTHPADALTD